ncbi:septal ring lytic transglycosylase RlpA family protein [Parasphingorhabdus sp.]|uniref:septal ring lytic transglycosylase RlpA family protein n=1 Tax=Parasphingorhabdus sp. TaxID=2709688 RepID=UPI003265C651
MLSKVRLIGASALIAALAGCGSIDGVNDNVEGGYAPAPKGSAGSYAGAVSDYPSKLGEPYKIAGKTYTPEDVASYDEVGYASWYGDELAGNPTANGERFNPDGVSAAHKTLPLPTYVEVTALDTGRTILVRINDRGPFANDRLIDLSHGAAKQLGIDAQGIAGVRVRKVNPNEQERAVLRSGAPATERIATPDSLLAILRKNLRKLPQPAAPARRVAAPAPRAAQPAVNTTGVGASYVPPSGSATPAAGARNGRFIVEESGRPTRNPARSGASTRPAVSSSGGFVVQVAAFSSKSRADALARKIGAKVMRSPAGNIWRVRYGPYANERDAGAGLAQARQRGYGNARILRAGR